MWLNRIANLVPLTRQRNSSAQNFNFTRKKKEYFQSKNGTSSYLLTTQVLSVDQWTPKIVEKRQRELLNQFIDKWDLKKDKNAADDPDFMVAGRGGDAVGYLQDDGKFVVKKGSRIAATTTSGSPKNYIDLRDELIKKASFMRISLFKIIYSKVHQRLRRLSLEGHRMEERNGLN